MMYLRGRRVVLGLLLVIFANNFALAASATRVRAFEYDGSGLLKKEIIEPNDPQLRLETVYEYDAYGNRKTATVSSPATGTAAISTRVSSDDFDARGRFPVKSTNALGYVETKAVNPDFGVLQSLTGPNSLTITWQYDDFGRKVEETRADGTRTQWKYLYCAGVNNGSTTCPSYAKYVVVELALTASGGANGAWTHTYFDALDRVVESRTQGFDGELDASGASIVKVSTEYDYFGRVYRVSRPYFSTDAPVWGTYNYDGLGRTVAVTQPDNSQTIFGYNGLVSTTTNALSQSRSETKDAIGRVVVVTDAVNGRVTYHYDPFGNLLETIDPMGNIIRLGYDIRGNKKTMKDPDLGSWSYDYNALGELVGQTDAKLQRSTMNYDKLGRITMRAEPDLLSTWTYDTCNKGVGKLCQASTDSGYLRASSYDALGRPAGTATTIDIAGAPYQTSVTYNADSGRVATETYPTGFTLKYVYTPLGYLKEVRNNASNTLYWSAGAKDSQGRTLKQSYGNSVLTQHVFDPRSGRLKNIYAGTGSGVQNLAYDYDDVGNVLSRSDANQQGLTETFLYDALRRLTSSTVNSGGAGIVTQTYAYDSVGNISSRSDMGAYTYGGVNALSHGVREVALTAGGKRSYGYDSNGNLSTEVQYDAANNVIVAKGRTASYTSFNMPQSLNAPGVSLTFAYGPEHQRSKQIAPSGTTIYLHPDNEGGLMYEKDIKSNGTVEHKHFVTVGGQVIALVKQSGATTSVRYMHQDSFGSITAVTDEAGTILERFAYEPFGKRRSSNGALDPNDQIKGGHTDRGYTAHEHLDELDLIHMNGRVYDPAIGRFTSADPTIPYPLDTQSFNRYSYASNNPLAYVDLSGFAQQPIRTVQLPTHTVNGHYDDGNDHRLDYIWYGRQYWSPRFDGGAPIRFSTSNDAKKEAKKDLNAARSFFSASTVTWTFTESLATGTALNGDMVVTHTGSWKEGSTRTYGTADQVMGQWFAFNPAEQIARDMGASQRQAFWLGFGVTMIGNPKQAFSSVAKGVMNPKSIRFSQRSIKAVFSDGGSIDEMAEALRSGALAASEIPAIRLLEKEGALFTLDNRRLEAFRRAGVEVPYRMATPAEIANEAWKFTTRNNGVSIRVRGE